MFRIVILLGLGGLLGYKLGLGRSFELGKDYVVRKLTFFSGSGLTTEEFLAVDENGQIAFVQDAENATPFSPSAAESALSFIKNVSQGQGVVRFNVIEKPLPVTV